MIVFAFAFAFACACAFVFGFAFAFACCCIPVERKPCSMPISHFFVTMSCARVKQSFEPLNLSHDVCQKSTANTKVRNCVHVQSRRVGVCAFVNPWALCWLVDHKQTTTTTYAGHSGIVGQPTVPENITSGSLVSCPVSSVTQNKTVANFKTWKEGRKRKHATPMQVSTLKCSMQNAQCSA